MDGIVMSSFMKKTCLVIILCLATFQSAYALDEAAFCKEMESTAKTINAEKGKQIDKVTKNDGMDVSCKDKRVISKQAVQTPKTELKDDAAQQMQKQWNGNFCGSPHFSDAIKNGWTMVMRMTFKGGQTHEITAQCS